MRFLKGLRAAFADSKVQGLITFTATLITIASVFYSLVEGWGLIDAVYFSVMTISTVGYGDITPVTIAGKIFTILYVLVGLGIFVAAASAIAEALLAQRGKRGEGA